MSYTTDDIVGQYDHLRDYIDMSVARGDVSRLRALVDEIDDWESDREELADRLRECVDTLDDMDGFADDLREEVREAIGELSEGRTISEVLPSLSLPWLDCDALTVADVREIARICGPLCCPSDWGVLVDAYAGCGLRETDALRVAASHAARVSLWIGQDAIGQQFSIDQWADVVRLAVLAATGGFCRRALEMLGGE